MIRAVVSSVGLICLAGVACAAQLQLGDWHVTWDDKRADVRGPRTTINVYRPPAKCTSGGDDDTLDGAVISFTPPYVSIYTRFEAWCGPTHDIDLNFATLDIQTGEPVGLLELFAPQEVLKALLADAYVKRLLAGQRPKTLDSLFAALSGGKPTCARLGRDNLTNFALYALRGQQVNVRLGLPWSRGGDLNCPFGFDQLSLWLPASKKLEAALRPAQARGYLMQGLMPRSPLLKTLELVPENQIGRP